MVFPQSRIPERQSGPGRFVVGVGAALVIAVLSAGAFAPERAIAHAGEVHTEEPRTSAPAPGPGQQGGGQDAGKPAGRTGEKESGAEGDAGRGSDEAGKSGGEIGGSSPPPAPGEPESDPLLHFLALGVAALAGLGLLLVRRRRLAG